MGVCHQADGKIEKYIMRKAFDTPDYPYLPKDILYRQKEQFSDGVGYNWIDELRMQADAEVGALGVRDTTKCTVLLEPCVFHHLQ